MRGSWKNFSFFQYKKKRRVGSTSEALERKKCRGVLSLSTWSARATKKNKETKKKQNTTKKRKQQPHKTQQNKPPK